MGIAIVAPDGNEQITGHHGAGVNAYPLCKPWLGRMSPGSSLCLCSGPQWCGGGWDGRRHLGASSREMAWVISSASKKGKT